MNQLEGVVQNVIQRFTAKYGTEVSIWLDIAAKSRSGFDGKTVGIVRETTSTLKSKSADKEVG